MNKTLLIQQLQLEQHIEGGYFARTYQSSLKINAHALMSSIYYMLTDDRPVGHFHKNKSDIMHYFHIGSPITYFTISPTGLFETFILGPDISQEHVLQQLVPGGYWKASVLTTGEFGLLSEAVSPGFEYDDMLLGTPDLLRAQYPHLWDKITPYVKT
ncbi:MAG: cupin [Legionella sp.]|nr:MAG: cupin [Legionella sp.]